MKLFKAIGTMVLNKLERQGEIMVNTGFYE